MRKNTLLFILILAMTVFFWGCVNDGNDGNDGADASEVLVESSNTYEASYGCDQGYMVTNVGVDNGDGSGTADNGILQEGEIDSTMTTCLSPDIDNDGTNNIEDVCPETYDVTQVDFDFDGIGDACDTESLPAIYAISRGSGSTTSSLYTYDPITNEATLVGDTGHALITIKYNPQDGLLYGLTRDGDTTTADVPCDNCLMTLDLDTGAATEVVALESGPHPSMAWLTDGSLYTWTEFSDIFTSVDTTTGEWTALGTTLSSWGHAMCSSNEDEIFWINGDGTTYMIDSADGARTLLGALEDSPADWTGNDSGEFGIRGDCHRDTLLYIGVSVTYGDEDPVIVFARLHNDAPPEVISYIASPIENLHYMAMVY